MSVKLVSLIDQWVALISFCRLEFIKVISQFIKTIKRMAATINVKFPPMFTMATSPNVWIKRCLSYMKAQACDKTLYIEAITALLDDTTLEKFSAITFTDKEDLTEIETKLIACFTPITIISQLRYEFQQRKQLKNESLELYAIALEKLVKQAYVSYTANQQIECCRDQFVQGVNEPYIKECLLKEAPNSLEAALRVAKTALIARTARTDLMDNSCVMRIEEEKDAEVDKVTNQLNEFKLQIDSLHKQQSEFFKRFEASTQTQPYQSNCFSSQGQMTNQQPPQSRVVSSSIIDNRLFVTIVVNKDI
jgi:hypothetical protein